MLNSKGINLWYLLIKYLVHQEYKDKKLIENVTKKFSIASNFGIINDVPKTDHKKRFNKSINSE